MPNNTKNPEWSVSIDLIFQLRVCSWPGPMFVNEVSPLLCWSCVSTNAEAGAWHRDSRACKSDKADYLTQDNSHSHNQA